LENPSICFETHMQTIIDRSEASTEGGGGPAPHAECTSEGESKRQQLDMPISVVRRRWGDRVRMRRVLCPALVSTYYISF
jgi:hypothetical protein